LLQFGITLVEEQREELMAQKTSSAIFAVLRLDASKVAASKAGEIVKRLDEAMSDAKLWQAEDFAALRREAFAQHVEPSLRHAAAAGVADSDDDASWQDEDGIGCAICDVGMPELYCLTCSRALCGVCHVCLTRFPSRYLF
jgi:hypothetical protein